MALTWIVPGSIGQVNGGTSIGSGDGTTMPTHSTGDLLLCWVATKEGGAFGADPSGWTKIDDHVHSTQDNAIVCYYKIAASGSESVPTVTWTSSSDAEQRVAGYESGGIDSTTPIGKFYSNEVDNLGSSNTVWLARDSITDKDRKGLPLIAMSANNKASSPTIGTTAANDLPYAVNWNVVVNEDVGTGGGVGHWAILRRTDTYDDIISNPKHSVRDTANKSHEHAIMMFWVNDGAPASHVAAAPVVESEAWTDAAADGSGNCQVTLPSGVAEDDLILIALSHNNLGDLTFTNSDGYTELADLGVLMVAYKVAGASESAPTFTAAGAASDRFVAYAVRISGAGTPTDTEEGGSQEPPNHSPGSGDYVWFAFGGGLSSTHHHDDTEQYEKWWSYTSGAGSGPTVSVVWKDKNASSLNPTAFLSSAKLTNAGDAVTVSVPASAGGDATVTPGVIAAVASLDAVTAKAGAKVTDTGIAAVGSVDQVSAGVSFSVAPSVIGAVASLDAPTTRWGVSVSQGVIAAVAALDAVTVGAGAQVTLGSLGPIATLDAVTTRWGAAPTPATIGALASLDAATIAAGSRITLGGLSATGSVDQVSAGISASVSPSVIGAIASLDAVSIAAGVAISQAAIAAVASLGTVSIEAGSKVTLGGISSSASLDAVTIGIGAQVVLAGLGPVAALDAVTTRWGVSVSPSTIGGIGTADQVTVVVGGEPVTVTPGVIAAVGSLGAVTPKAGVSLTAPNIAAVGSLAQPTIAIGEQISPSVIAAVAALDSATIGAGTAIAPSVIAAVGSVDQVTVAVGGDESVSPGTIAAVATVPAVTIAAGVSAALSAIQAAVTLGDPTLAAGATISVPTIGAVASVPAVFVVAIDPSLVLVLEWDALATQILEFDG
jgi:hypothetical protein